jgi:nitrogen regulatory protein PII
MRLASIMRTAVEFVPKPTIVVYVEDEQEDLVITAIAETVGMQDRRREERRTNLERLVEIRTREEGSRAL